MSAPGPVIPVTESARNTSPFRSGSFRVYWFGGLSSNIGTWLHAVTSSVLMFNLTQSAFMVGVLSFANFLPILAFSLLGGVVSDRVDRRKVVLACSVVSVLVSGFITGLALASKVTPAALLAVSFLLGSCYAFAKPALSAMLPALVGSEGLAHATAINTLQFTVGQVIGSTLSALILALYEPWVAFATNTFTYLGPIAAMMALRKLPVQDLAPRVPGLQSLREGLAFVVRQSGLMRIVGAIVLANGVIEGLRTLAPVITDVEMQLTAEQAGLLVGAVGAGSVIGALAFGHMNKRLDRRRMVQMGFALQAIGLFGAASATSLPWAMTAALIMGIGFAFIIPLLSAEMQERAPDALRGRVMATFAMAHLGLRPLTALLAGSLAALVGTRMTLGIFVFLAIGGLIVLRGGRTLHDPRSAHLSPVRP